MKIVTIVGARPQFIKAAAVSRAIQSYNNNMPFEPINEIIVHTGQHYDHNMSDVFFDELDIPRPLHYLQVGSGSHGKQTGNMLEAIENVLIQEQPDWLLVYGDTNSTLAGALAAAKMHIPIAHVEAGLRSFNRRMPEEINRILTDRVSTLLLCPTSTAVKHLEREGVTEGVHQVGDVMYDCMLYYQSKSIEYTSVLAGLGLEGKDYALATVHRAENTDNIDSLIGIFDALNKLSADLPILVALHPRTKKYMSEYSIQVEKNVILLDPLTYIEMIQLESKAKVILTDSGGVQKEAFFVGTPCITLRMETEWVETVDCGANILTGADSIKIIEAYNNMVQLDSSVFVSKPYGHGDASQGIISLLVGRSL